MPVAEPGRVVEFESGLRWRVLFPELEHPAASGYLRELAASDCSPATLRSYAFDLLRWFRFLHRQYTPWERAERLDVRSFVEWLQQAPNPQRTRRRPGAPPPGSVNPVTGKPVLAATYASRTINHQLSVLFGFYEWACSTDAGPLLNPVPAQRGRGGERLYAHHNPMENFVVRRRRRIGRRHRGLCGGRSPTMRPTRYSARFAVTATARWCRSGCRVAPVRVSCSA